MNGMRDAVHSIIGRKNMMADWLGLINKCKARGSVMFALFSELNVTVGGRELMSSTVE